MGFQVLLVDVLDRFPVKPKVPGDVGDGHHLAQLMDRSGQSPRDPQIRVKEFQVLNTDSLAMAAEQFAVLTLQPDLGGRQVLRSLTGRCAQLWTLGAFFPHKWHTGTKRWSGMTSITAFAAAASTVCLVILIRRKGK